MTPCRNQFRAPGPRVAARPGPTVIAVAWITILLTSALVPGVAANHWTLYAYGVDDSAGATLEDDGAVSHAPGSPLHGLVNRVVNETETAGSGGLFFDVVMGQGSSAFAVHGHAAKTLVFGRADVLLPTPVQMSAWYGWWNDLNGDGTVDDAHDAEGAGDDEFTWRGHGSGSADLAIRTWMIPEDAKGGLTAGAVYDLQPPAVSGFEAGPQTHNDPMEWTDNTARDRAEQEWRGPSVTRLDSNLLTRIQFVTVAGAPRSIGSPLQYDVSAPAARIDVDDHTAVSPEAESLYIASARTLAAVWPVRDIVDNQPNPFAIVGGLIANPTATVYGAQADAEERYAPRDLKEPNHVEDDYGGHAWFGGVGDAAGTGNTYEGYRDAWHLYFDAIARVSTCSGGYAAVPGTSTSVTVGGAGTCQWSAVDPVSVADPFGNGAGSRTAWGSLMIQGHIFLWMDRNADTHVGTVCDPEDPDSFDATGNTCADAPQPWPHTIYGEVRDICDDANAAGSTFTLTPMGGAWPEGTLIIRDAPQTTRVAYDQHWEPVGGTSDSVTLRWQDSCRIPINHPQLQARDTLVFPLGSDVPIRVDATVSIPGYEDAAVGITVGREEVTDVDVLLASL